MKSTRVDINYEGILNQYLNNTEAKKEEEEEIKTFPEANYNHQSRKLNSTLIDIPQSEISKGKKLYLKVIESENLSLGLILTINPGGLESSIRKSRDGVVYFEYAKEKDNFINDFIFPDEEIVSSNHFKIKYDLDRQIYKLRNLVGIGTFIKLNKKYVLTKNSIFSFGTTHISISFPKKVLQPRQESYSLNKRSKAKPMITLKVIYGKRRNEIIELDSSKKTVYKIGRQEGPGIELVFPDESISRIQCTIFYEHNKWFLVDSDGINMSTNGTWILAKEYIDIYDKMIIRAGLTLFEAHYELVK